MQEDKKGSMQSGPLVLVAEDSEIVRQGIRHWFALGFPACRIVFALSGAEAVRLALREPPLVVIMDVDLPELDGIAATRQIKQALPGTHVLMHTFTSDPTVRAQCIEAGATDFFEKGTGVAAMGRVLQKILKAAL